MVGSYHVALEVAMVLISGGSGAEDDVIAVGFTLSHCISDHSGNEEGGKVGEGDG